MAGKGKVMDIIEQLRQRIEMLETGLKLANRNANHWEDALVELATSTFHSAEDYKERALEALKVNNYENWESDEARDDWDRAQDHID